MLAPFAGGIAAHYFTWRHMQFILSAAALIQFFLVYFFLPETMHPGERGVEKDTAMQNDNCHERTRKKGIVLLNPLGCLYLLRSPMLLSIVSSPSLYAVTHIYCVQ